MGRKIYYPVKPVPVEEVKFEFEVWARIIKDAEGNDIQLFIKEDKRRGVRKDSSFYYDGYWEVFEFDDAKNETRFRAASGVRSVSKYDEKERLKEYYQIDGKGDTLESQKYEWRNGRLIRMTANGVVRNYIYGKTLQDTVWVKPSDEGFNYHSGYNGTAGKMPEEGTRAYETFSLNPYGHVHFGEMENKPLNSFAAKKSSGSLNALMRSETQDCIREGNLIDDMPEPQCVKFVEQDALNFITSETLGTVLLYGYPCSKKGLIYGMSNVELFLDYECECNESGKYQPYLLASTYGEGIDVYRNFFRYNSSGANLQDCYWSNNDLLRTYNHETVHIRNAKITADNLAKGLITFFMTQKKNVKII
jgi:hypothetical protein